MRTISILFAAIPLLILGCSKQAELENQNQDLRKQMAAKDQYIDEMTSMINEVHAQLENAWLMEKKVVKRTTSAEGEKTLVHADVRQQVFQLISDIDSMLSANRKKVSYLQHRLNVSTTQYAGLQKMVDDLKNTIAEREKSVADLQSRVEGLEGEIIAKNNVIAVQDTTIRDYTRQLNTKTTQLNTVYYVAGKRKDLKGKGIITDEGGVLWGLLGTTTVMTSNFDGEYFQTLDKSTDSTIDVEGTIDQIIPKRDPGSYAEERLSEGHTVLRITNPDTFWRERHLVIVSK